MKDDTIKREDAIGAINGWLKLNHFPEIGDGILYLVPSADRPQGEWKHLKDDEWLCSNCEYVVQIESWWKHPLESGKDYCEHCGAKMFAKGINVLNKKGADENPLARIKPKPIPTKKHTFKYRKGANDD